MDKDPYNLAQSLTEQHQAVRDEQPVTPQVATGLPARMSQDELVEKIKGGFPDDWKFGSYRIDSSHTEDFNVKRDLDSARSRISRYAKLAGLTYSTQQLHDAAGERHLVVHLSLG